mmetsp:Transcript_7425/g.18607  ORF Transcript_7425/g.18607 Transcript_7425/m.18607 type:complete len:282 (+) Transcript_7425:67-912(+)
MQSPSSTDGFAPTRRAFGLKRTASNDSIEQSSPFVCSLHAVWKRNPVAIFLLLIAIMGSCLSSYIQETFDAGAFTAVAATSTNPTVNAGTSSPTYETLPSGAQKLRVRNVYDGDTLTLVDERRVRLLGVDTPEMKPLQPYAEEAKEYTKSRCNKKEIWLLIDGKDHYDRLLGHVFVREESGAYLCINEGLVYEGFANAYTPRKNERTFNWDKLLDLQRDAREKKRGVWKSFKDTTVYKTTHGSAYHKRTCSHLSNSRNLQEIKVSVAMDQGLHPCRSCMSS